MGGARIACDFEVPRNEDRLLQLVWGKKKFEFAGCVVWEAPADPKQRGTHRYGFKFRLDDKHEALLKALVNQVRGQPPGDAPAKIRDYWSV